MVKKFKRRDGFRGMTFFHGPHPFTINPTEKDAKKRMVQKRPIQQKKKK